jgi:anion transporter
MNLIFKPKALFFLAAIVVALAISIFPIPDQPAQFSYSTAVILVTLVGWSTGVLPSFLIALGFFALASIFSLMDTATLFSGFGSTAIWLIISGFVIGSAISTSGLGKKIAAIVAPHITSSYPALIFGLIFIASALGFIMPSSVGRAVVLVPIGMALADGLRFTSGSNGRLGIATALAVSCNMPSFAILPANIPNMIFAGTSETLYQVQFSYVEYLVLHFPILGIVKSILLGFIVLRLFPDTIAPQLETEQIAEEQERHKKQLQIKTAVLLGVTLLLWVTDSIHGVNPAWIGLATAVILLLPKVGVVEPKSFNSSVDFGTLVFVSAALGLGALVNYSGLGSEAAKLLTHLLSGPGHDFLNFMTLSVTAAIAGLVTTTPGVPTVLAPMAGDFAQSTGLSLNAVLMTQVVGFSTVMFPYQVPPLIIAMQLSKEPLAKLLKVTLPLAAITIFVLMPLDYLWWQLLGWLG